jgi:hypothetical protein
LLAAKGCRDSRVGRAVLALTELKATRAGRELLAD